MALVSLLIVTFNIFGFYRGFLRIRLRNDEEKNFLLRRPIAASTLSYVINTPSATMTSLPRHAEAHNRTTASRSQRRVFTAFPSPKTETMSLATQPRPVTLRLLKGQDSPCVLSSGGGGGGRSRDDGRWYNFSDGSFRFYAYSAFLDDRSSGVGGNNASLVRIIALGTELDDAELEKNIRRFSCVLHYDHRTGGSDPKLGRWTVVVPMVVKARPIGFGWNLNEVKLKEYIFTCVAHTPGGSPPPRAITVVTSPDRLQSVTSCVPIEVPAKPRIRQDIAICVQASYGQLDWHRIVEWFELQRILGVSRVGVYDHALDPGLGLEVLRHYEAEGMVELRKTDPLPIPGKQQLLLHGTPVINDCMYRYMHSYRWIFVIDFDEVLVPRSSYDLREMVGYLENMTAKKTPPPVNYLFLNQYYFFDSPPDPAVPTSHTILRYRKTPPTTRQGVATKSYVDPEKCAQMHNHYCMGLIEGLDDRNVFEFVDSSVGTSNHYKRCHLTAAECQDILRNTTDDDVVMKYSVELRRNFARKVKEILA